MRIRQFAFAVVAVALAVVPALVSADQAGQPTKTNQMVATASAGTAPTSQIATLNSLRAVPLSPRELAAVKGLHVHFVTVSNGKLHIAGNPFEHNWSNLGGTDGKTVAPSYKGLCVAHGNGSIFIPTRGGITTQCPPGS